MMTSSWTYLHWEPKTEFYELLSAVYGNGIQKQISYRVVIIIYWSYVRYFTDRSGVMITHSYRYIDSGLAKPMLGRGWMSGYILLKYVDVIIYLCLKAPHLLGSTFRTPVIPSRVFLQTAEHGNADDEHGDSQVNGVTFCWSILRK